MYTYTYLNCKYPEQEEKCKLIFNHGVVRVECFHVVSDGNKMNGDIDDKT
jgi:hypothetical protein